VNVGGTVAASGDLTVSGDSVTFAPNVNLTTGGSVTVSGNVGLGGTPPFGGAVTTGGSIVVAGGVDDGEIDEGVITTLAIFGGNFTIIAPPSPPPGPRPPALAGQMIAAKSVPLDLAPAFRPPPLLDFGPALQAEEASFLSQLPPPDDRAATARQ
jgi:hypothetical protein